MHRHHLPPCRLQLTCLNIDRSAATAVLRVPENDDEPNFEARTFYGRSATISVVKTPFSPRRPPPQLLLLSFFSERSKLVFLSHDIQNTRKMYIGVLDVNLSKNP